MNWFYIVAAEKKANEDESLPAIVENMNRLDVETETAKDIDEAIMILRYTYLLFFYYKINFKLFNFFKVNRNLTELINTQRNE